MNDAIQAQNDPALILYKNNIQQTRNAIRKLKDNEALILYKNNIQLKYHGEMVTLTRIRR